MNTPDPLDHLPSRTIFDRALRENHKPAILEAFNAVHLRMTQLADTIKLSRTERKSSSLVDNVNETEEPTPMTQTTLHVTAGCRYWKWNCGWWQVDPVSRKVLSKTPLGHVAFRKKPLLNPKDPTFFKMPRPQGEWRRVVKTPIMYHSIYQKNVYVDFTDGILACIRIPALMSTDGLQTLIPEASAVVHLANLSEIGVPVIKKPAPAKAKLPKPPRQHKLPQNLLDLL